MSSTGTSAELSEHEQRALPAPGQTSPSNPDGPAQRRVGSRSGGFVRTALIVLLIVAAVGGAIWKIRANAKETAATNAKTASAADRPVPVQVVPVGRRDIPVYLEALGTVTAYNSVTIKTRVDGQLMRVLVREGQAVKQGQLLIEIDPKPYAAAVAQAQGLLTKDEATAANARAEAARYTALLAAGVVSKESEQLQLSNAGQAQGAIESDQAAIEAAKVNLGYTRITSPIDGVVGLRQVDPGNIVHAADTTGLLLVTQLQPIAVIFTLPEDQLPQVLKLTRGGQKLVVDAYDRSETTHLATGSLLTVDNAIDPTTGTDKVKAVFPNADNALFPNQFVNVRLVLEQMRNATVVSAAAIQTGNQGSFIYVVREGKPPVAATDASGGGNAGAAGGAAAKRKGAAEDSGHAPGAAGGAGQPQGPQYYVEQVPVKIALTQGNTVVIASGVNPGDSIVIDGQEKLKQYSRVKPAQAPLGGAGRGAGSQASSSAGGSGPGPGTPAELPPAPARGARTPDRLDEPRGTNQGADRQSAGQRP